jgi:hypothetical protein
MGVGNSERGRRGIGFEFRRETAYLERAGEFPPPGEVPFVGDPGFVSTPTSKNRSSGTPDLFRRLVRRRVRTGRNGGRDEWARAHFLLL